MVQTSGFRVQGLVPARSVGAVASRDVRPSRGRRRGKACHDERGHVQNRTAPRAAAVPLRPLVGSRARASPPLLLRPRHFPTEARHFHYAPVRFSVQCVSGMCDIFGLCDGERTRKNGKYEWLGEEERPNAAAIEALRRQQYSRDLELPERIDRGGAQPKRFIPDKLGAGRAGGADAAAGSSTGGSVYKRGDRAEESSECEPPAKQSAAVLSAGGGQRLGGDVAGVSEAADEEAHAKASEAALKRSEATPQGFSADGLRKLKQAAGAQK